MKNAKVAQVHRHQRQLCRLPERSEEIEISELRPEGSPEARKLQA